MAKSDKERSSDYRGRKSENHKRVSPWFHEDELSEIDKDRGEDSRASWLYKVAKRRLKNARRKLRDRHVHGNS